MDPEVTSNFDPQFLGQDNLILPQLRVINFGLNISF
jgi:TonB-dependent starch-binding outer membrane protein SusC